MQMEKWMAKDKDVFFSIIVPVYNVQEYLKACVKSVLEQTFDDFELILVDDGSKDQSGTLCDALAEEDPRITAIHQDNLGASAARNHGLRTARGRYILFLDSDDFYPQTDLLENIRKKSDGQDMVCINYARYTDHLLPALIHFPEEAPPDKDELLLELVKQNAFTSSACLKAVKRSLLTEHGIEFEEGTSGEDIAWNARLMEAAKNIALAPDCVYAYRVREGSITQTVTPAYVKMLLRILRNLTAVPAEGTKPFRDAYNGYIAFQYCTVLINARLCRPPLDKNTMGEIRKMTWLLEYDCNRIVKLIHSAYQVLGFEITSRLLLIYFKIFCK